VLLIIASGWCLPLHYIANKSKSTCKNFYSNNV